MATDEQRNNIAELRNVIAPTVYEERAGGALRALIAGPHADKLTARVFSCSIRTAQNLRRGRHWTIQRLTQASAVLGAAFDQALYSPVLGEEHYAEMAEITDRLARLEARIAEMDRGGDTGLAPTTWQSTRAESRDLAKPAGAVDGEVT